MSKLIDLTGQKFGRLTVIEKSYKDKHGNWLWLCHCDCGNTTIVYGTGLRSGATTSCGCLRTQRVKAAKTKHGLCHTRLYTIWKGMRERCNNPHNHAYARYGGRGIKVCSEWENSFITFYEWAKTNGYDDTLTIDRIDNNKGYSPENCRWATMAEQNQNNSRNRYIDYNGKKLTLTELAREWNMSPSAFIGRLRRGWSIERALTTPVKKR